MNSDLRAIEAALRGEPHDPSNLSPEAASVVLPLVRRVVQERDELRATADLNVAMEKMEAALVEWSSGVRHRSNSEGCVKVWYDPAIGQFCIEGEDLRTAKRDRLVPAVLWWANPRKKPERAPEHKALSERCVLAEERVMALGQERVALKAEIDMLRRERHAERQRVDERDQDVAQLREALEEEGRKSEERRLALLAECMDPEGGADLGFTPIMGKWFKPDGDHRRVRIVAAMVGRLPRQRHGERHSGTAQSWTPRDRLVLCDPALGDEGRPQPRDGESMKTAALLAACALASGAPMMGGAAAPAEPRWCSCSVSTKTSRRGRCKSCGREKR